MKKILLCLLTASMFALPGYAMEEDDGINLMHNNEDIANQQRVVDYERARETAANLFDRENNELDLSELDAVWQICHITDICTVVKDVHGTAFDFESEYIAGLDDCVKCLKRTGTLETVAKGMDQNFRKALTSANQLRYMLYRETTRFAGWVQEAMDHQIKAHGLPDQRFLALHGVYNSETGYYNPVAVSSRSRIYKREYVDFLQDMLDELMQKAITYLRQ